MAVANPASFHAEARYQMVCARCGKPAPFHAHHVVDKQTLKSWGVPPGDALYDTRNAMRLCEGLDTDKCHMRFEKKVAGYEIALTKLSDDQIDYAFEVGGTRAYNFLHREYTGEDPRVELKLRELEMAA